MATISTDISAVKSAGFSSWMEFYCSVNSRAMTRLPIKYGYEHRTIGKGEIELNIPSPIIDALAAEDGKDFLKKLKVASFGDLMTELQDARTDKDGFYYRDLVVRSLDGALRYERIIFDIVDVHKMAHLEGRGGDYLVYEEEDKYLKYKLKNEHQ